MHKEQRRQLVLKRKNFLPTLLLIVSILFAIIGIVYFLPPNNGFVIFLFFLLIFLFFLFVSSLVLSNTKRGLIISTLITIFLILRLFGVGNILNALLLLSLGIIAEIYARFTKRN